MLEQKEEQPSLQTATCANVNLWPINEPGHRKIFTLEQNNLQTSTTVKSHTGPSTSRSSPSPPPCHKYKDGYYQIWDGWMSVAYTHYWASKPRSPNLLGTT